jgi:hypothetical protein
VKTFTRFPWIVPRRQAKSSPVLGEDAEIRELLLFRLTKLPPAGSLRSASNPTGYSGTRLIHI